MRLVIRIVIIILLALPAAAQSPAKITYPSSDNDNNYYLAFPPAGPIDGSIILFSSFGVDYILPETRLHGVANANNLLTIYASTGKKFFADTAAVNQINIVVKSVITHFKIDTSRIVLGGFGYAGSTILRYAELSRSAPTSCVFQPKAVFTVASPVDLFSLWHTNERQLRKNYFPGTVSDARFILATMTADKGSPANNTAVWQFLSPFHAEDTAIGNERYLVDMPVRVYYDTDIQWQLAFRRNSLYDTDIPDATELINRLLLQGNKQAEFISATKPGLRSDGLRTPFSLSIVNEVECIQWVKSVLGIFDPVTWQSPFVFPLPTGWQRERFSLPPDFAPSFAWKGIDELHFHPGWGDSASVGYWTYAYVWWIDGQVAFNESNLAANLQLYFTGLIGRNIGRRHIPAEKIFPPAVSLKKIKSIGNDLQTFNGTVHMLDYMAQRPITLNVIVHIKPTNLPAKSALLVETSLHDFQHPIWKELDSLSTGFTPPAAPAQNASPKP